MYDVLFITPNIRGVFKDEALGTLLLATILKNNGISCKVLPFGQIGNIFEFDTFLQQAIAKVDEIKPKIVSMYTRCDTFHISLKMAEQIKSRWNDICIVFGGPQSDTTSTDVISHIPYVDFVCCGEGETTIYPFFSSILHGTPDLSTPGLVYRHNNTVTKNPRPKLIEDLDTLPMIDLYGTYLSDYPEDLSSMFFPIDVGRGCPFGCAYCSTQAFWGRKYRLKSPQRIIEEVKEAHKNFGVTKFLFSHDMFTFNRKSIMEVCRLLINLDFPVKWICSARLDCLDPELIDLMVEAGMESIFIGIESGSKRIQKLVHKNLNLDNVIDKLIYFRDKNIAVDTSFIYGFPEETKVDLSHTLSLMAQIMHNKCGIINTHLCTFLPKTELSEQYRAELTPCDMYSNFTGDVAIKHCEDIIKNYPMLFPQLMEYKTELRADLKYFTLFILVWMNLVPIYQYISERYSKDRLIDMYYDFVEVNRDALDKYGDLPLLETTSHLIREDKLHLCLETDPNYDIVTDIRTIQSTETSDAVKNGATITQIYCFDPTDLNKPISIREYERCIAVVKHTHQKMIVHKQPL